MPAVVKKPGYEMPHCPTRPLWCGTFLSSHSMVSYVSVASSTCAGPCAWSMIGRTFVHFPSLMKRPRTS